MYQQPSLPRATVSRNHGVSTCLRVFVAPWFVIVFLSSRAFGTVVIPAEFTEMVNGSQVIVHGVVTGVQAQMVGSRRTIESLVTVRVVDTLKGGAETTTVFRVPGGQVGRYRRVMVGAPEFAPGDEVVLFLAGRAPSMPMPFGLNQGVYRVTRTAAGATVRPLVGEGRVVRGDPARRPVAVDAFVATVRAIAERQP